MEYTISEESLDKLYKQNDALEAEVARLTAGSEAMQDDARNNTATIKMLMAQLAELKTYHAILGRSRIALTFYREWCAEVDNTRYPFGDEVENEIRAILKAAGMA